MLSLSLSYYLCVAFQLLYPTYASFKALQSTAGEDDTQWLTYWVVYAFLSTAESVGMMVIQWIPLYWEIKLLFIIWMVAPQTQGAKLLYDKYVHKFLIKYGSKIDPVFSKTEKVLQSQLAGTVAKLVEKHGPVVAENALKLAAEQASRLQDAIKEGAAQSKPQPAATGPLMDNLRKFE